MAYDSKTLENFRKAGKLAAKVRDYAKTLIKTGMLYVELADAVEKKIFELGARPGFPCNISVNSTAAHHVPLEGERLAFADGDLVKIDLGVHVEGAVADTAVSVSIGKDEENEKLIKASEAALAAAIKLATPGRKVSEIGRAVEQAISSFGFRPIKNLSGHLVDIYDLHADLTIPNFDNKSNEILEKGMAIAIEPFATDGDGFIREGDEISVFRLERPASVRNGREILEHIASEYVTLPFAKRWLARKFNPLKVNLFLKEAIAKGMLHPYNVLLEKKGSKVAQTEHTILVSETPEILTA
ncbi:MAG: type II methionyl aminopeptidase [DPANN group archaeon]|nr:type II methionyl aminopeptidase [DPANN group archaeon]